MSDIGKKISQAIADARGNLGDSAESVRSHLAACKIDGKMGDSCFCALANYYRIAVCVAVGIDAVVDIDDPFSAVWYRDPVTKKYVRIPLELTAVEDLFVRNFDMQLYPELIAK